MTWLVHTTREGFDLQMLVETARSSDADAGQRDRL